MGTGTKRTKGPLIPEPSLRFIAWSAVIAAVMLGGIIAIDYAEGWTGPPDHVSDAGGAKH
jgi:hypothetical protein